MTISGIKIPTTPFDSLRIKPWARCQDDFTPKLTEEQYNRIYEIYRKFEP